MFILVQVGSQSIGRGIRVVVRPVVRSDELVDLGRELGVARVVMHGRVRVIVEVISRLV